MYLHCSGDYALDGDGRGACGVGGGGGVLLRVLLMMASATSLRGLRGRGGRGRGRNAFRLEFFLFGYIEIFDFCSLINFPCMAAAESINS